MPRSSPDRDHLHVVRPEEDAGKQDPMPRRRQIDVVSDFERAAEKLPKEMVDDVRRRQRDVANKRERAQLKDGLLRTRVRGQRGRRAL
jgi:hypothetical protein